MSREKAARYGLNTGDVNTTIQAALGGTVATTLLEGDRQFNVTVRLLQPYRDSLESVGDIKVAGGNGGLSISGTGMARPGSGTSAVGIGTKANIGNVNGISIRTRHP
jgi:Cu/Ag efflux pump CusA